MSTKLNAEELLCKRRQWSEQSSTCVSVTQDLIGYSDAIHEVAQPIADERDELREALEAITAKASIGIPHYAYNEGAWLRRMADDLGEIEKIAEAILAKYPKP